MREWCEGAIGGVSVVEFIIPFWLLRLGVAREGPRDCGNHEWYKWTDATDLCYHCYLGDC